MLDGDLVIVIPRNGYLVINYHYTMFFIGFENFFIDAGKPISDDSFSPPLENVDIREIIKLLKERYDIEMLA